MGIRDGRIVMLAEELWADDEADATGRPVMSGGIKAHCHIAQESATGLMTADDYRSDGISAAFGGSGSCMTFAAQHRHMSIAETLDLYHGWGRASVLDCSFRKLSHGPDATFKQIANGFALAEMNKARAFGAEIGQ